MRGGSADCTYEINTVQELYIVLHATRISAIVIFFDRLSTGNFKEPINEARTPLLTLPSAYC
jgi:hypothetical protein